VLSATLTTLNAPRPVPITGAELLRVLSEPDDRWRPHVEALFDEVPRETLHWLVLSGAVTFPTLAAARRLWGVGGAHADWIDEMARFSVARAGRVGAAVH